MKGGLLLSQFFFMTCFRIVVAVHYPLDAGYLTEVM